MSDHLDDPAVEPVETAQAAVEPTSETPVPWGDDFNPERAWKTITHLRDRESKLEKQAKEFERLQQDDSAFREFVSQRGYEIPDDEPDEPAFDDQAASTPDPRVDELHQWMQQQEVNKALDAFNTDIDARAAKAEVALTEVDREWLLQKSIAGGFTADAVTGAFDALAQHREALRKQTIEDYISSKRGPTPPQPGKAGAPEFDHSDRKARQAHMAAIIAADQQD